MFVNIHKLTAVKLPCSLVKSQNAPKKLPSGFAGWIMPTCKITEAELVRFAGTDAAVYLRVQRFGKSLQLPTVCGQSCLLENACNLSCTKKIAVCRLAVVPILHPLVLHYPHPRPCSHGKFLVCSDCILFRCFMSVCGVAWEHQQGLLNIFNLNDSAVQAASLSLCAGHLRQPTIGSRK